MADKCALIVDDDHAIRRLLVSALIRRGVDLDEANDGDIAIEKLRQKKYDVVLLDLMMPRVNGFEVLRTMADEGLSTSVVVLSAASQVFLDDVKSPLVTRVFRKPFDLYEVEIEVLKQCGLPIPPDLLRPSSPL